MRMGNRMSPEEMSCLFKAPEKRTDPVVCSGHNIAAANTYPIQLDHKVKGNGF
jgi:hypothetical protein